MSRETETTFDIEQESIFHRTSDIETTRWDNLQIFLDRNVIAPWRIILNDPRGLVGSLILLFFIMMALVGPYIVGEPVAYAGDPYLQPFEDWQFPLGTDNQGYDLLTLVVTATPFMFKMLLAGAVFTIVLATTIGTYAGYIGGVQDRALSTLIDIMITIPGLPLIIVLSVLFEPRSPYLVGIILTIAYWAGLARNIRAEVLSLREESYVEASQAMGKPVHHILSEDVLPNIMPYISINFVNAGRHVIFASVALYFLGILPFTNMNWGVMMNYAYRTGSALSIPSNFYWFAVPTAAVVFLSIGLVLFAQSLDHVFNPRARAKHASTIDEDG